MDKALLGEIWARAIADPELTEDTAYLALAACEGSTELDALLGGTDQRPAEPPPIREHPPERVWLEAIHVEGFRGVGQGQTLPLVAGPGLTLVVGRNGSGKSSFAEALELVMTGTSERWQGRPAVWRSGWRNLDAPTGTTVRVTLRPEAGPAPLTVERRWTSADDLDGGQETVRQGTDELAGVEALGWTSALSAFRPLLSYNELGSMLTGDPSSLHDRLSALLGLEGLHEAADRLRRVKLARSKRADPVLKAPRKELVQRLGALDDDRAAVCATALGGARPDLDRVQAVLDADDPAHDAAGAVLLGLISLPLPTPDQLEAAVGALRAAMAEREALVGSAAEADHRRAALLSQALDAHAHGVDDDCPVCGSAGVLSPAWHAQARAEVVALQASSQAARAAEHGLGSALDGLAALHWEPPPVLRQTATAGLDGAATSAAWQDWSAAVTQEPTADGASLAEQAGTRLIETGQGLVAAARDELERREGDWRRVSQRLTVWLAGARQAEEDLAEAKRIEQAWRWVQAAEDQLRKERLRPIVDACKRTWTGLTGDREDLRLEQIGFEGSQTTRRVDLQLELDGGQQAALGVLSQGELHALALSLFLPRAVQERSPFRFLVIDDPVQAMDSARVDRLAKVLEEVASTRQVLVFTHDDRLREAIRRLQIDAKILTVQRSAGSRVTLAVDSDPVSRFLEHASAVAQVGAVPSRLAAQVVPSYCRWAVEAACVEAVRCRDLGTRTHDEVERQLAKNGPLRDKLGLVLGSGHDLDARLFPGAEGIVRRLNHGSHQGDDGDLKGLIAASRRLAQLVRGAG